MPVPLCYVPTSVPVPRLFRRSLASRALPSALVGLAAFVTLTGQSAPPEAVSKVSALVDSSSDRVLWGVGLDHNTTTASLKAVVSAVNRAVRA